MGLKPSGRAGQGAEKLRREEGLQWRRVKSVPHLLVIFEDHTVCDRAGAALRPEVAL